MKEILEKTKSSFEVFSDHISSYLFFIKYKILYHFPYCLIHKTMNLTFGLWGAS